MCFSSDTKETGVLSTSPVSQIVTHSPDCSRKLSEVISGRHFDHFLSFKFQTIEPNPPPTKGAIGLFSVFTGIGSPVCI